MNKEEEWGRLKAQVEELIRKQDKTETVLCEVRQWQWKVIGFLSAITVFTDLFFLWVEFKRG
jgi:hypothetical protein